jgi:hypothetical protein
MTTEPGWLRRSLEDSVRRADSLPDWVKRLNAALWPAPSPGTRAASEGEA